MIDLGPATRRLAALLEGVDDDQLAAPTPIGLDLGAAIDHVGMFAGAFVKVAATEAGQGWAPRW